MPRRLPSAIPHHVRRQAIRRKAQHRHSHFYARCQHWSVCRDAIAAPIRWGRERWVLAGGALLLTLLALVGLPAWASAIRPAAVPTPRATLALVIPPLDHADIAPPLETWHAVTVQPGQTLSDIFHAQGLSLVKLQSALDAVKGAEAQALRALHPGDEFAFRVDATGQLQQMRFDNGAQQVLLDFGHGAVRASTQPRALMTQTAFAHGVVNGSLFNAANKAGMDDAMVIKLADIFKYDIDFAKELRAGDSFTVIYDKVYRDGSFLRDGDIFAAEFVNNGHRYTAYRFTPPGGQPGYYSADGRQLRKSLMRTPVAFTRISSLFSLARLHPILGYTRAHKGVDYAAPIGTPIHAAGDGVITYRGWERGYGNFITIKHDAEYTTAYGHMSRFAPGEHVGSRVTQGEVIGYVGMTGLATGPHLHYEVRVYNKPENPLTVTMPPPAPLAGALMAQFKRQNAPLLARMQMIDASRLAHADGNRGRNVALD